jgi:hypothetical protein
LMAESLTQMIEDESLGMFSLKWKFGVREYHGKAHSFFKCFYHENSLTDST